MFFSDPAPGLPDWLAPFARAPERVAFDDLVGLDKQRESLLTLVARFRERDTLAERGSGVPTGVICHGPVGTGKTTLVKATVTAILNVEPCLVIAWPANATASQVGELAAYLASRDGAAPYALVLLDELDALTRPMPGAPKSEVSLALASAMDGLAGRNRVLWLATTTRNPQIAVDDSLSRPGRLSWAIRTRHADHEQVMRLLRASWSKIGWAPDLDAFVPRAARMLGETSSAADVIELAVESIARAVARDGASAVLTVRDVQAALDFAGVVEDREGIPLDRSAWHEGSHLAVALALGLPARAAIASHDGHGGRVTLATSGLITEQGAIDRICAAVAGLEGERLRWPGDATLASWHDQMTVRSLLGTLQTAGAMPGLAPVPAGREEECAGAPERRAAEAILVSEQHARARQILTERRELVATLAERIEAGGVTAEDLADMGLV